MLPIGLIGLGSNWEAEWRPAFQQQSRLVVSAFYDPVQQRGERAAEDFDWNFMSSVRRLWETPKLKGVVALDPAWLGRWVIEECDSRRIPLFVATADLGLAQAAESQAAASGESLILPTMPFRYSAMSMRIRELTATRLGVIREGRVEVMAAERSRLEAVAEAIDWCRFVVQSSVASVTPVEDAAGARVEFRKDVDGRPVTIELCWSDGGNGKGALAAELVCREGVLIATGEQRVRWKAGAEEADEELTGERTSAAIQLDLFARRLAGGLIPVASLEDVATSLAWARRALGQ